MTEILSSRAGFRPSMQFLRKNGIQGVRDRGDVEGASTLKILMRHCWDEDPRNRPSMALVVKVLEIHDLNSVASLYGLRSPEISLDMDTFTNFWNRYAPMTTEALTDQEIRRVFESLHSPLVPSRSIEFVPRIALYDLLVGHDTFQEALVEHLRST